ncbi:DNA ligase 1-like [Panonychus citri]|uniref:DNA ligase 1-like n=1 Tax=Panonychus citri TaxID=50023 RepID=UPI00230834DE|nr:DNA ligase 1-like [Panonychus citri]
MIKSYCLKIVSCCYRVNCLKLEPCNFLVLIRSTISTTMALKRKREESETKSKPNAPSTNGSVDYNPGKSNYDAIKDASWKDGDKTPFIYFTLTLKAIEEVSSRLKMIEILANYLWSVKEKSPEDLLPSIYLCLNKLGPAYEGLELGIGETIIMKALANATGRKVDHIKADIKKKGDLGLVAEDSRTTQSLLFRPPRLTVQGVFKSFREIALFSGQSSGQKKTDKIQSLIVACRDCEARYLVRSLAGKLRIGLAEQSLLSALAQSIVLGEGKSKRGSDSFKSRVDTVTQILKTVYCRCPNYQQIINVLLEHGWESLDEKCQLIPGVPLKPMLAHPTKGVDEVLRRFNQAKFTCEFKYDGERAQIHLMENGEIRIFSRNQEDNTSKYPDIISRMKDVIKPDVKSFIIDSEAVAWDSHDKQILPFQVLSTRKRKDASEDEIKVHVCIFAFDLLYLNGKSFVTESLSERRKHLRESFKDIEGKFMMAVSRDVETTDEIQEFLDESIKAKCEGLMVKTLDVDATYEIAKRSRSWLKIKKDYLEGVGDTLDLVVIGAYIGKGKRTGRYGGYLLACYDDEKEEFQSICKLGTGFKDEDLENQYEAFKELVIERPKSYYNYDQTIKPDVWFDAVQVWEVKCADLSISPVHRAAFGSLESEKGISLRFPRFIRIREDKKSEEATSAMQVVDMYNNQEQIKTQTKGNDSDEEMDVE